MLKLSSAALALALMTTVASAQTTQRPAQAPAMQHPSQVQTTGQAGPVAQTLASIPGHSITVTEWYKQNVYDPNNTKIGEIMDVLMDQEGRATALIISVGGFLGAGSKDVAVPFNAVQVTNKDNKRYLVMNANKDALKNAKGFKYDRNQLAWIPEDQSTTTGSQATPPRSNAR
jgi:sporulation protein YlmC with PRC-barrel domain